jgi:hypothetical protein
MITKLEKGKYYLLDWTSTDPEWYDFVLFVEKTGVRILASTTPMSKELFSVETFDRTLNRTVEITRKDLPLYVGWTWISPYFSEHLKS